MTCILGCDPARRRLPVAMWPAPFRQLWEASLVPGDILEPGGARALLGFKRSSQHQPALPSATRQMPRQVSAIQASCAACR